MQTKSFIRSGWLVVDDDDDDASLVHAYVHAEGNKLAGFFGKALLL